MPRNIDKRVERLLLADQSLRDSDKKLLLAFWESEGLYLSQEQKDKFMNCTTAESITRARRKAKEKGIKGSEQIEEKRYQLFEQERVDRSVNWDRG